MGFRSFYDILGVSENCSEKDIRKAFRIKSLALHPDKQRVNNAKNFIKMKKAYDTLVNNDARLKYDQCVLGRSIQRRRGASEDSNRETIWEQLSVIKELVNERKNDQITKQLDKMFDQLKWMHNERMKKEVAKIDEFNRVIDEMISCNNGRRSEDAKHQRETDAIDRRLDQIINADKISGIRPPSPVLIFHSH